MLPTPAVAAAPPTDADDSWFSGGGAAEAAAATFDLGDGTQLEWQRGEAGDRRRRRTRPALRRCAMRPAARATVEPYMGMAAHVVIASRDASVFAHLHPSGSISMAAMQKFAGDAPADPHAGHVMPMDSAVAIPYAFPEGRPYRVFVQVKRGGQVKTAAFDVDVK